MSGVRAGLFSLAAMTARLDRMPDHAPGPDGMARRLGWLARTCAPNLGLPVTPPTP